jgi:hypothetical protein
MIPESGSSSRVAIHLIACALLLAACGRDTDALSASNAARSAAIIDGSAPVTTSASRTIAKAVNAGPLQHPVLFVTQVPTPGTDPFASRMSTFANHLPGIASVPRGGDLMIRYPDGSLRNLTREAGYGMDGQQGDNAIAVREPTVHWDGDKAIFSMVVGAPPRQYVNSTGKWQLYEVTGLVQGQTAVIAKVPNQPTDYNNVSPLYSSEDRILFASDRPIGGAAHLYPQLDEYESTATITGLYSLDPASGQLRMLNHTPSGAFSPTIDSYGRLIFVRWDHLQRDQQADAGTYGAVNYASEAPGAAKLATPTEVFPEPRQASNGPYGRVAGFTSNLFTPWQMHQDGSGELTLNHIGRQEMAFGYLPRSFLDDPALSDYTNESLIANRKYIRHDGGVFHLREDPTAPGVYYGILAREFGSMTSNQIVRFTGAPTLNAEQMVFEDASPPETNGGLPAGRFRNPLPMTGGRMVAAHTPSATTATGTLFRLRQLVTNGSGMLEAGPALTPGIQKTVSWWSPDVALSYSGPLWEIEPVEVVARARPRIATPVIEAPEAAVFAEERISEHVFRDWMKANGLALIVTRNQTSRDRGDKQQPFNLRVPQGTGTTGGSGRVYDIAHYQILQANAVRGYDSFSAGRRPIAQPIDTGRNPANASGPPGSVRIAADGSTAALVPANRALTWQTTDSAGVAIVRERVWITMQPGEIRTCAGCHGENSRNQAGLSTPTNTPEALRALLRHWKQTTPLSPGRGSRPLLRPRTPTASSAPTTVSASAAPASQIANRMRGASDRRR